MMKKSIQPIWLIFIMNTSLPTFAQDLLHWRIWNDPNNPVGSYIAYAFFSNHDQLFASGYSADGFSFICMNGYDIYSIKNDPNIARIAKENSSGIIWTLNYNYLAKQILGFSQYEFDVNNHIRETACFEIEELKAYSPSFYSSSKWNLPFIPWKQSKILFLLEDRLMQFDANTKETVTLQRAEKTNLSYFIHMTEGKDGSVWISSKNGLGKMIDKEEVRIADPSSESDPHFLWEEFLFPQELQFLDFAFPIETKNKEVWGTVYAKPIGKRILVGFDGKMWKSIFQDKDNDILLGWPSINEDFWLLKAPYLTPPFAFYSMEDVSAFTLSHVFDQREEIISRKKDLSGYIRSMTLEPNGGFWISIRGLARYAPPIWGIPSGVKHIEKTIYSIFEDKQGRLFFAAEDSMVVLDGNEWHEYLLPHGMKTAKFTQQCIDTLPDGRLTIITQDRRLLLMTLEDHKADFTVFERPDKRKWENITSQKDGNTFFITLDEETNHRQVELYNGEKFTPILHDIDESYIGVIPHHVLYLADGCTWIGASKGISQWKGGEYQTSSAYPVHFFSGIFCIMELSDGRIWAGGINKILEWNGTNWKIIKTGLANVHDFIIRRDKSIWLASQTGVYRYLDGSWLSNTHEDGLPTSRVYKLFEDSKGRLWAGTACGIAFYNPKADPDPPRSYIDPNHNMANFLIDEKIYFVYTGIDRWNYTLPDRLLFSHRVDEGPWSLFSSDAIAMATGLSTGKHRLEVRAMDRNGNIEKTPARFSFSLSIPWYRESAVITVFSLCATIILFLIGLHFYHHINLENLVLLRTAQLRSTERHLLHVSEHERQRIGQDLHDEVVQDLTAIAMSGELLAMEIAKQSQAAAEDLQDLIEAIDHVSIRTRKLALGLAPMNLEKYGLFPALQELILTVRKQSKVDCTIHCDTLICDIDRDAQINLYRIVQESIQNALKHADPQHITVRVNVTNSHLEIQIEDDGKGFSVEEINRKGMGLNIMRSRADLLGGTLTMDSQLGKGTRILCKIPISLIHNT